jgi:ABC-type sugar transport system substrate-binding protein
MPIPPRTVAFVRHNRRAKTLLSLAGVLLAAAGVGTSLAAATPSSAAGAKAAKSKSLVLGAGQCKGITIGFVQYANDPDTNGAADGVSAAVHECGGTADITGPAVPDATTQLSEFQNLIASGAKGIIIQGFPASIWDHPVATAVSQGIDVESQLIPTTGTGTNYMVGPGIAVSGIQAAKAFAAHMAPNAHGEFIMGLCIPGLEQFTAQATAMSNELHKLRPGVSTELDTTSVDPAAELAAWQGIIAANPHALGFWGICSGDLPILIKLKQEAPNSTWLSGAQGGESSIACPALKAGQLTTATSARDFAGGYVAAELMLKHLVLGTKEPVGFINTGVDQMTKANCAGIAKTNASPDFAHTFYQGLINSLLAHPNALTPQEATYTKTPRNPLP